jgi:LmbE family N-acetylglucosaminyl deacetylase
MSTTVATTPSGRAVTLLLLAHHDDEVFCAGHIAGELAAGRRLVFVWATAGGLAPARIRRWEGRAALRVLGLEEADGVELGFRDQHALRHIDEIACVSWTLVRHAGLAQVRVLVPAYEGGHPDHDAVNAAAAALRLRRPDIEVMEFAMYRRGRLCLSVQSPAGAPGTPGAPFSLLALDGAALRLRRRLARANASQLVPSLLPLLMMSRLAGRGHVEPVRPLPAHDYSRPPERRPLLYELYTARRFTEFSTAALAALSVADGAVPAAPALRGVHSRALPPA